MQKVLLKYFCSEIALKILKTSVQEFIFIELKADSMQLYLKNNSFGNIFMNKDFEHKWTKRQRYFAHYQFF